jgi:hypothetical protein
VKPLLLPIAILSMSLMRTKHLSSATAYALLGTLLDKMKGAIMADAAKKACSIGAVFI